MVHRVGVVTTYSVDAEGRRRLAITDADHAEEQLIEPGLADAEIIARFRLDRLVHAEKIDFCRSVCVDGPLAGTPSYAVNRIGYRVDSVSAGRITTYELATPSADGRPAELRFVERRPL